ncbi:MAG: hypothetical protein LBE82_09220, partial [Chitinophagaceae bacterium]|nr:hypothetical protein [Chitinophagaceae bacterium]
MKEFILTKSLLAKGHLFDYSKSNAILLKCCMLLGVAFMGLMLPELAQAQTQTIYASKNTGSRVSSSGSSDWWAGNDNPVINFSSFYYASYDNTTGIIKLQCFVKDGNAITNSIKTTSHTGIGKTDFYYIDANGNQQEIIQIYNDDNGYGAYFSNQNATISFIEENGGTPDSHTYIGYATFYVTNAMLKNNQVFIYANTTITQPDNGSYETLNDIFSVGANGTNNGLQILPTGANSITNNLSLKLATFPNKTNAPLSWSSDNNVVSQYSTTSLYKIDNGNTNYVTAYSNAATTGGYTASQTSHPVTYYLIQSAYNSHLTFQSSSIKIPAFTHPKTLTGVYNSSTNKVDITWTIDPITGTYNLNNGDVITSGFVLYRATKSDFSDAVPITLGTSGNYDPVKGTYSYSDDVHANAYYFVARNYTDNPNWNFADSVSFFFSQKHIGFDATSNVQLILNNEKIQDTLKWNVDNADVWSIGSTFNIVRYNRTNGNSNTYQLTKDDYFQGFYIDSFIQSCNEYYYTLQIAPASSSGYTALKPFQTTNSVTPVKIGTVAGLTASKGYYQDHTVLNFVSQGVFDSYVIKSRVYGSGNAFTQIGTVPYSAGGNIQYVDANGNPGVYYEYMVYGVVNCNGVT